MLNGEIQDSSNIIPAYSTETGEEDASHCGLHVRGYQGMVIWLWDIASSG
jgi:hypothetical protein